MSFWTALVVIVAIVAFTAMRIVRYAAGSRLRDHLPAQHGPSPREIELQREVEDLRERISVLERIATEDRHGKAIADEIESLRDS